MVLTVVTMIDVMSLILKVAAIVAVIGNCSNFDYGSR